MQLTVLGSSGSYPSAGSVCSGYLVRTGTTTVMLDAGNGSTSNLRQVADLADLDAIVVSHRHADHCVDLIGLHHAIRGADGALGPIPLYAHPSVIDVIGGLTSAEAPYAFADSFAIHHVEAGDELTIGDLRVQLFASVHTAPTVSMRCAAEGRVLTYSADSAGGDQLVAAARDADLLLCEATWQGDAADYPGGVHLTAAQAGEVASAAGARRLMLTHVAGGLDREVSRREAATTFAGEVELATDLLTTEV